MFCSALFRITNWVHIIKLLHYTKFFISKYNVPDGDDSRVGVVILKVDCEGDATVEYVTAVSSVDNVGTCTFFVRGSTFVPYKINDHL